MSIITVANRLFSSIDGWTDIGPGSGCRWTYSGYYHWFCLLCTVGDKPLLLYCEEVLNVTQQTQATLAVKKRR